ncbi:hypothetical protein GJU40_11775 [Bacillus lacus]|uniref:Uncharacterized protein n=1 Tax=Metabacillus lacus TaxID=1983721 RepID=A0A7X2IZS9_9BACI|nr:hypothetical protein [Metabacillus lacus]MRX72825.1 hypothetical protein [Metabacillus lacus]
MINARNTPNMAGLIVSGDYLDFEQLYEALHSILPDEGEDYLYESARLRVLGLCYDIRHAMMGNREFEYKENGLHRDIMLHRGIVGSEKNIYFSFQTFYPEMLFNLMALNHFVENVKFANRQYPLDRKVMTVKNFQASILECLQSTLSAQKFLNTVRSINTSSRNLSNYTTQYLDLLNIRYLDWEPEKREKNISIIAKRLAERGDEYLAVRREVQDAAAKYDCHPSDIRLAEEYPEDIDW